MATEFSDCLLIVNPLSTNQKKSKNKFRSELNEAFGKSLTILLLNNSELAAPSKLHKYMKKLSKTSLLAIIGGDGTVNMVINELLKLPTSGPKNATILPLWGGNANDLASMANGRNQSLQYLLRNGKPTAIKPIKFSLQQAAQTKTGFAMCYLSFGAIASSASKLDNSKLVKFAGISPIIRLLTEVVVGTIGLAQAKRFKVSINDKQEAAYDLLLINGPRIAKLYRTPMQLSENGFLHLKILLKHPLVLSYVHKLLGSFWRLQPLQELQFEILQPIWMQCDGEVQRIGGATTVQITLAEQPVKLLMTK